MVSIFLPEGQDSERAIRNPKDFLEPGFPATFNVIV